MLPRALYLVYLGVTNAFALLRLLPGSDHGKDAEILALRHQLAVLQCQPKWVISMGACASSGGLFNNYAIVQGVDHIVPVDIYLPVPRLVPGGILIADNAVNHRETLRPMLDAALADDRVDALIVPIGKGELVCRKL